jgi:hypothetical protein
MLRSRSSDVGRTPVALQLDGKDTVVLGQDRDGRSEAQLDGEQAAVEQDERWPLAKLLEIEVEPVDLGVWHTEKDGTSRLPSSRGDGGAGGHARRQTRSMRGSVPWPTTRGDPA